MAVDVGAILAGVQKSSVTNTAVLDLNNARYIASTTSAPPRIPTRLVVWQNEPDDDQFDGFDSMAMSTHENMHDIGERDYFGLRLSAGGCIGSSGQKNCTAACADPKAVWGAGNLSTLANCMVYPLIASALAWGVNVTWTPTHINYRDLEVPFPGDGTVYGIVPDHSLDLNTPEPWAVINDCTTAYCEAFSRTGEACNLTTNMVDEPDWRIGTFSPALHFNTTFCDSGDTSVNPDLGGVGMVIAYLIQFSIILAGWTLNLISEVGTATLVYGAQLIGKRRHGARDWHRWAKKLRHDVHHSRLAAALNATLVEFQKTQAFFMLAVVIAVLQAVHNARYLEMSTFTQVINNSRFISTVALSGSYPVTLNLMILRRTGGSSPFVLSVSVCCVIISSTLWLYNQAHILSKDDFRASTKFGFAMCGNTNPMQACSSFRDEGDVSEHIYWALRFLQTWLFPPIVMAFLTVEEFKMFRWPNNGQHGERINVFDCLRRLLLQYIPPVSEHSKAPCFKHRHAPGGGPSSRGSYGKASATCGSSRLSRSVQHIKIVLAKSKERFLELRYTSLKDAMRKTTLVVVNFCYRYVPMLAELGLVSINIMLLMRYLSYQRHFEHAFWSLGQIISVTIWVPVGIEYIHSLAFGIEEGFEYRLKSPYHVRRDADADSGVDSSTEDEESTAIDAALPMSYTKKYYMAAKQKKLPR
ncbi:hypothetical protein LTR27_003711 [Elasticomyces elasticus]|nr:hypothetical protein LTR27_003711 [Elasticomyces elasticus]